MSANRLDMLTFVDHIRLQFENEPTRYRDFITIMKTYKKLRINDLDVVIQICELFLGYPTLLKEFNAFLPNGYRLEPSDPTRGDEAYITLSTPQGITVYPRDYPRNRSENGRFH